MKKNLLLLMILIFALISFNFQCGKELAPPAPAEEPQYLEMPLGIYPVKKSYSVGDTIWVEANIPDKMLTDTKKKTKILTDTSNFDVPFLFEVLNKQKLVPPGGFCEFINPGQLKLAVSSGYFDPKYNVYWNYNTATIVSYGCSTNGYKFKIGFKLKEKGAFYIGLSQSQLKGCNEKTVPYHNTFVSYKYETEDVNLNVYYELPKIPESDPYWIGFNVKVLYDKKGFVVKVD